MFRLAIKQPVRLMIQHYLNSLHFYSFICRLKISRAKALRVACAYEHIVHPFLYCKRERQVRVIGCPRNTDRDID
ncbi:MAG: hypothetical protein OEU95_04180 [Nitrospirota bacterium]|nr:hypothetical protein [Nitrospirota bacterium]